MKSHIEQLMQVLIAETERVQDAIKILYTNET